MKKKSLVIPAYSLPYNPDLIPRARNMRKNMTNAEVRIWFGCLSHLKHRVYRQKPIDNYIVDFYIPKLHLVIEIDGETHFTDEGIDYDKVRTAVLEGYGLIVLRFKNDEVINNFDKVYAAIYSFMETSA